MHSSAFGTNFRFGAFNTQAPATRLITNTVEPHPKKSSPGQSSALWCDSTPPGTCVGRHPSSSRQRPLLRHSRGNNSWARDTAPHGSKLSMGQVKREILLAKPVGGQPDSIQLFCRYVSYIENAKYMPNRFKLPCVKGCALARPLALPTAPLGGRGKGG